MPLPSLDAQGHYATINSGVGEKEAIWHFRAALNVAALSCTDQSIRDDYNRLLKSRKAVFTAAYASETARLHGAALDQHQTKIYNFFPSRRPRSPFAARPMARRRRRCRSPRPSSRPMRQRRSIASKHR
jgi:hypothetical protein